MTADETPPSPPFDDPGRPGDREQHAAWVEKVRTLSEALPYMHRYSGRTVVIKYGGHAMGDDQLARLFARDVALLKQVGLNPVIVHGGGPQIARMLDELKIESQFVRGLRVTDAKTVEIVEMVLAGSINKQVVGAITAAGGRAVGLSGKDGGMITARKLKHRDPETPSDSAIEAVLDLGFVGEPAAVDPALIRSLSDSGFVPVIAPIGAGGDGQTYNINADTAAGAIAAALGATRLLMLSDVDGVRDTAGTLLSDLSAGDARTYIDDGTISGGMIPKIETCLDAIAGGVRGAVILDGRLPHAILIELFTEAGTGTLIGKR